MAVPNMVVTLVANTTKFNSGMRGAANTTSKFGSVVGGVMRTVGAGLALAGAAFVKFASDAVGDASRLEQATGGVESVFKQFSGTVVETSKQAAEAMGLSMEQYQRLGTMTGTLLKNAGVPLKELAGQTETLVTLASDLSATFGGSVEEAATAMNAALRGEFEPIRRFGIALSQAQIQEKALSMTHQTSVATLTKRDKILATQALLLEQGADASGQFARESDTLANKQQVLQAKWDNLSATLGEKLLPFAGQLADALIKVVDSPGFKKALDNMLTKFEDFGTWLGSPEGIEATNKWADAFISLADAIGKAADGLAGLTGWINSWPQWVKDMFINMPEINPITGERQYGLAPGNPSAPGGIVRPKIPSPKQKTPGGVTINFNTPVDSVSAGREVQRVLNAYHGANGRP